MIDADALFRDLREASDPGRSGPMSSYMRNQFPFLGISATRRRDVCKPHFAGVKKEGRIDWPFVDACWQCEEREFQYVGADYLRIVRRHLVPGDLPRLKALATSKSWWDTVDSLDRTVGDVIRRFPDARPTILEWARDENMWVRRIAIDHQLLRKGDTDTELLADILQANFGSGEFFIDKAIGWALRDYSKTSPEWVRGFIEDHRGRMSALSIREASKYL